MVCMMEAAGAAAVQRCNSPNPCIAAGFSEPPQRMRSSNRPVSLPLSAPQWAHPPTPTCGLLMSSGVRPVAYSMAWLAPWLFGCVILPLNLFRPAGTSLLKAELASSSTCGSGSSGGGGFSTQLHPASKAAHRVVHLLSVCWESRRLLCGCLPNMHNPLLIVWPAGRPKPAALHCTASNAAHAHLLHRRSHRLGGDGAPAARPSGQAATQALTGG